jgi:hypothetical protein
MLSGIASRFRVSARHSLVGCSWKTPFRVIGANPHGSLGQDMMGQIEDEGVNVVNNGGVSVFADAGRPNCKR